MLTVFIGLGLVLFSFIITYQYHHLKSQLAELDRLRQKTVKQDIQIYAFDDKIRLLEQEMTKLVQNDKKLQALNINYQEQKKTAGLALGGSDSESVNSATSLKGKQDELIRQMHLFLDNLLAQASALEQSQHRLDSYFEDTRSLAASWPTFRPCPGYITSGFGYRIHPLTGQREFHRGIDLIGRVGQPIVAAADGVVVSVNRQSGYGLMVTINHGYGTVTRYGHCSKIAVKQGQKVKGGQRIAAVGNTGRSSGPHLHYEIIRNGIAVNPIRYLARK